MKFCVAGDSTGIHEGMATWLVSYLWRSWRHRHWKLNYYGRKIRVTVLCDVRLPLYVKVVSYLLGICATDNIIAQAIKKLEFHRQAPGKPAALYATSLYTKALWCDIIYGEKRVKSLFVEGLDASIYKSMRDYLEQYPGASQRKGRAGTLCRHVNKDCLQEQTGQWFVKVKPIIFSSLLSSSTPYDAKMDFENLINNTEKEYLTIFIRLYDNKHW